MLPSPTSSEANPERAVAAVAVRFPAARALEFLALYVATPMAVRLGLIPVPRLVVLGFLTAATVFLLARDPTFDRRRLWSARGLGRALPGIVARTVAVAGIIAALVHWLAPERWLALPLHHPAAWAAGLALYPWLSAWPQEVLYRVLFFHRYGGLFRGPGVALVANAAVFSALHLVYPNAVAPLLSLPAGLLLAVTYRRTGTMGPVWLEHTAYGLLLFTLGLDGYFYDGRV